MKEPKRMNKAEKARFDAIGIKPYKRGTFASYWSNEVHHIRSSGSVKFLSTIFKSSEDVTPAVILLHVNKDNKLCTADDLLYMEKAIEFWVSRDKRLKAYKKACTEALQMPEDETKGPKRIVEKPEFNARELRDASLFDAMLDEFITGKRKVFALKTVESLKLPLAIINKTIADTEDDLKYSEGITAQYKSLRRKVVSVLKKALLSLPVKKVKASKTAKAVPNSGPIFGSKNISFDKDTEMAFTKRCVLYIKDRYHVTTTPIVPISNSSQTATVTSWIITPSKWKKISTNVLGAKTLEDLLPLLKAEAKPFEAKLVIGLHSNKGSKILKSF